MESVWAPGEAKSLRGTWPTLATDPLAGSAEVKLSSLAHEHWMMDTGGDCPDTLLFWDSCRKAGFEPSVPFEISDYNVMQGFVAAGMGVALVPDIALVTARDDVVVRRIAGPRPSRRILAATVAGSFAAPAREAMLDVLAETAEEFAARQGEVLT